MATVTVPQTLKEIEDLGSGVSYPGKVIAKHNTALVLFAAAWHGRQDAYWVEREGLIGSCVDIDRDRLKEMRAIYPEAWTFYEGDAFEFAEQAWGKVEWDVVSLDPNTNLFDRCADNLGLWCSLARHVVVLGAGEYTVVDPPDEWKITHRRKRSDFHGGVYWIVLERK